MSKGKFLAGVLSTAMVLGSITLPENISISGFDFGAFFAQAADEVASGTCGDNITWMLDSDGVLTLSGTGEMYDYELNPTSARAPWYSYCEEVTSAVIEDGITGIGAYAFYDCCYLTNVSIPDSVTNLGDAAFSMCDDLEEICLPEGITCISDLLFYCCSLTSIDIPDGVTSIGRYAFRSCDFTSIDMPESVTTIEEGAFMSCWDLENVNLPDGLISIGDGAFSYCRSLTSIEIPDGLESMGTEVFIGCNDIEIIYSDDSFLNGGTLTLYGLDSTYDEVLTISEDYPTSYQIDDEDLVSCTLAAGESVEVSSDGYVEIAGETWYESGNLWTTTYIEGADSVYWINYGTSYVEVDTSSGVYYIKVTVEDYSDAYVDQVIDEFINENITDDMTDLELMEAICSLPASYDYSASYSSANGMVVFGGGDCWASTDLIIRTCEKLGITAWSRNGNKDTGAGSGHMNAIAELNDLYYVLEAGYYEDSPRSYSVTVRTTLFSTTSVDGGVEIYQYDGNEDSAYDLVIPEEIDGETVVSIGDYCFSADSNLASVYIPDTVTNIGEGAFGHCTSLTEVTLPNSITSIGVYTFYKCSSLTEVTIPDTVTSIEKYAFYYCTSLTELVLPDGLVSIGEGAISYCASLTEFNIPASVQEISNFVFAGSTALTSLTCDSDSEYFTVENGVLYNKSMTVAYAAPAVVELELVDTVESFVEGAFAYNDCLIKATIPSSVTTISECAFWACSNLTTVVLSDTITTIETSAFYECTNLTDISLPDGLESIGNSAFACCSSLVNVDFPDSLESLDDYAFYECTSLTELFLPEGLTDVGEMAFAYCYALTEIDLPSTLTTIDQGTFWECTGLTSIEIPEGVETIELGAFYGCTSLTSVTLSSTVQTIAQGAFESCSSLMSIIVPDTVTEIGQGAFGCMREYNSSTGSYEDITIDGFVVYGHPDTTAEEYAEKYGFIFINIDDVKDLPTQDIVIEYTTVQYTGSALEPSVSIEGLTEGTDYTVTYENNIEIGTAIVIVTGIQYYMGTYQTTFSITKAEQTLAASITNSDLTIGCSSFITAYGIGTLSYSSSDESVVTVSYIGDGYEGELALVTAVGIGTATITVTASGDDYYNSATETINITVTEIGEGYLLGDVNNDGDITYLDAMMVLRYDAVLIDLDDTQLLAGDVNKDGEVNSLDAIKILRYDAGLITSF